MVGQAAAHARKILDALPERGLDVVDRADVDAGRRAQLLQIGGIVRVDDIERLLRAEGGQDFGLKALVLGQHAVVAQVVDRVIGRAERADVALRDQRARRACRALELCVCGLPNRVRGLGAQQLVDAEKPLELKVGPVVDRVADQAGHDRRKAVELVAVARAAGHIFLGHRVCAHDAPLVVVPGEPRLADVRKLLVFVNFGRVQMAVVVEDRHVLRVLVVQPARRLRGEQEVLANKALHVDYLAFCFISPTNLLKFVRFLCLKYKVIAKQLLGISCLKCGECCYII